MGVSRIEQLIEEIYEFIGTCRMQPFSTSKVVVPKDELYDLLDELRLRTPDEIKRYQKIISNRDSIMQDADERADLILAQARDKANSLVEEHEITQQAYYKANEMIMQASQKAEDMVEQAGKESEDIRTSALSYSNDILADVENNLAIMFETSTSTYDGFLGALKDNLEIVSNNKRELDIQLNPPEDLKNFNYDELDYNEEEFDEEEYYDEEYYDEEDGQDEESEFDLDEDVFLDHIN